MKAYVQSLRHWGSRDRHMEQTEEDDIDSTDE